MIHVCLYLDLAAYGVHAVDLVARVGDDISVHQNRAAHGVRIKADAQLVCPIQGAVLRRRWQQYVRDAVIGGRTAEIRPLRRDRRVDGGVGRRRIQRPDDSRRAAALRLGDGVGFRTVGDHQRTGIVPGHGQGCRIRLHSRILSARSCSCFPRTADNSRVVRQLLHAGENVPQMQQRVHRFRLEGHFHRGDFRMFRV